MKGKTITLSSVVLRWARATLFGNRKQDAATKLKITLQELELWETSDPTVSVTIYKRICKIYKRHPSVMLLKNPPISQEPPKFRTLPNFESINFDSKTFMAIRQAQEIQNNAIFLLENRENLNLKELSKYNTEPILLATKTLEMMRIDNDSRFKSKTSREQLTFWKRALETLGIIVLQQSFPLSDSRAFTIYDAVAP